MRSLRRPLRALTLGLTSLLVVAACSDGASPAGSSFVPAVSSDDRGAALGSRAVNRSVVFLTYYDPAVDAFWNQMLTGARNAASLTRLTLNHRTTDGTNPTAMRDLINAAIPTKPAALVVPFNDPSWEGVACDAQKAGIPVFAYNVAPSAAGRSCVKSFVGQDFFAVGAHIAERLLQSVPLRAGEKVLCPAEEPDQQYAVRRREGVESVLKSAGVHCTPLRTSGDDASALDALTSWFTANPDVKAVVALGGTPHRNAVAAQDRSDVRAPIVGFDTAPSIVAGIRSGRILATADQQGYVQGFQAVVQSALFLDLGLSPADVNSGGNDLIDKSNVGHLDDKALAGVRY